MAESSEENSFSKVKMGVSLWLTFCVFVCLWFVSRFMRGRRQLRNNLHVIEDGLRRMQEDIEQRQRENSMGYGENLEDLAKELFNNIETGKSVGLACAAWILIKLIYACFWLPKYLQSQQEKEKQENEIEEEKKVDESLESSDNEELLAQDKKND